MLFNINEKSKDYCKADTTSSQLEQHPQYKIVIPVRVKTWAGPKIIVIVIIIKMNGFSVILFYVPRDHPLFKSQLPFSGLQKDNSSLSELKGLKLIRLKLLSKIIQKGLHGPIHFKSSTNAR